MHRPPGLSARAGQAHDDRVGEADRSRDQRHREKLVESLLRWRKLIAAQCRSDSPGRRRPAVMPTLKPI